MADPLQEATSELDEEKVPADERVARPTARIGPATIPADVSEPDALDQAREVLGEDDELPYDDEP